MIFSVPSGAGILLATAMVSAGLGAGGVWTTRGPDTTPYAAVELDTAVLEAQERARALALDQAEVKADETAVAADSELSDYSERTSELEEDLGAARRATRTLEKELSTREDRITQLERALSKVRTVRDAPAADGGGAAADASIEGELNTAWILSADLQPWPSDCSGAQRGYQILVNDGSGATMAIASMVAAEVSGRTQERGILTLQCSLTYSADFPIVADRVYEFVVVDVSAPETELKSAVVPGDSLQDGSGPEMYVSLCPTCPE